MEWKTRHRIRYLHFGAFGSCACDNLWLNENSSAIRLLEHNYSKISINAFCGFPLSAHDAIWWAVQTFNAWSLLAVFVEAIRSLSTHKFVRKWWNHVDRRMLKLPLIAAHLHVNNMHSMNYGVFLADEMHSSDQINLKKHLLLTWK